MGITLVEKVSTTLDSKNSIRRYGELILLKQQLVTYIDNLSVKDGILWVFGIMVVVGFIVFFITQGR